MTEVEIPFVGQEIDTDEGATDGVVRPFGGAVLGLMALFGASGIAAVAINRVKDMAGVDNQGQIPGV